MSGRCEVERAGTIELYFYGELTGPERLEIGRHVARCAACREALDDLGAIRTALADAARVASPPGGDWAAFMSRLESAVGAESVAGNAQASAGAHGTADSRPAGLRFRVVGLAMAAALALVTMTVLWISGGLHRQDAAPAVDVAVHEADRHPVSGSPDHELTAVSRQHFARSKLVVLGLATRDTAGGSDDWHVERDLASSLLSDTRLYRMAAEDRGMASLAGVMRDLELVLLEASMTTEPDRHGLEQVQRLIRRRDLVTKLNTSYVELSR
jgi:hypothetical protein